MTAEQIIAILGYVFGAGGLLAFLLNWKNSNHTEDQDAVSNWQPLYNATVANVNRVEAENKQLKEDLQDLQTKILELTVELEGYKRFERYVAELEVYSSSLLHVIEPLVSPSAYKRLEASKPIRVKVNADDVLESLHVRNDENDQDETEEG